MRGENPMVSVTAGNLGALRRGLLVFCYQLLGSPFDGEDAVQEATERAWRARETFGPAAGCFLKGAASASSPNAGRQPCS
jgi:hypothetical protein